MTARKAAVNTALLLGSLIVTLLIAETAVRISQYLRFSVDVFSFGNRGALTADERLGWRATPNFQRHGEWRDSAGQSYPLSMSTDERGFRAFGNTSAARSKLLVLGDSFTHAIETSDGDTYADHLAASLQVELFTYGAGGFGTLQQYLWLDQAFAEIQPDVILLQLCANDFSNNSEAYEAIDLANNNGLQRPYLLPSGEIYYAIARDWPALWQFANQYSRLLAAVLFRVDLLRHQPPEPADLEQIRLEAIATTDTLLGRLRARAGAIPIYAFVAGAGDNTARIFRNAASAHGIEFIDGIEQSLKSAEAEGLVGRVADGAHWSPAGHRVIGAALADYLRVAKEAARW